MAANMAAETLKYVYLSS